MINDQLTQEVIHLMKYQAQAKAVKITSAEYKTLKYIGLSAEQATKCTTLSNYQAFLDAGWTTGF